MSKNIEYESYYMMFSIPFRVIFGVLEEESWGSIYWYKTLTGTIIAHN